MRGHWNQCKGNVKPKMRYQDKCWSSSFQILIRMTFHNVQGLGRSMSSDKIFGTHITPVYECDFKSEHRVLYHHFAYMPTTKIRKELERNLMWTEIGEPCSEGRAFPDHKWAHFQKHILPSFLCQFCF